MDYERVKRALADCLLDMDMLVAGGVTLRDSQEIIRVQIREGFGPDWTMTLVRLDDEVRTASIRYKDEQAESVRLEMQDGAWKWVQRKSLGTEIMAGFGFSPTREELAAFIQANSPSGGETISWPELKKRLKDQSKQQP